MRSRVLAALFLACCVLSQTSMAAPVPSADVACSHLVRAEGTSNLVGYYAVQRSDAKVYEWDFAAEKLGRFIWHRAAKQ